VPATRNHRPGPGGPSRSRPEVELRFDGRRIRAIEGEPLAAALLVAGEPILSRSFRFHRPRGLMCSTGQCGWCECEVDGVPSVRTCRVPVRDGLVVRSEHALPTAGRDLLGLLDLGSRLVPPTFYHHRFLRPRRLRKAYLDVIRWFGGRGRLPVTDRRWNRRRALRLDRCDVLVVGAGGSGLAAARAAQDAGTRVVVLEADDDPFWPSGEGLDGSLDVRPGTTAVGWYDGTIAAVDGDAAWEIQAGAVVVATGSYERVPPVPGADRPGVVSATLAGRLLDRHDILVGRRPALIGDAVALAPLRERLIAAGAAVQGPFPTAALRAVAGRRGANGVVLADELGQGRAVAADAVIFGDRVPSLELVMAAGAEVRWDDGRLLPDIDIDGRTSVPTVWAVGGAAGRPGEPDLARAAGQAAAATAASGSRRPPRPAVPARGGPSGPASAAAISSDTMACFCEDVRVREIRAEVAAGFGDPELLKRRTGALTGPCQGKYCLCTVAAVVEAATRSEGVPAPWRSPTTRPPLRPIRLGDLADAPEQSVRDEAPR
jgi:sarcosine oxidase subunit alpha